MPAWQANTPYNVGDFVTNGGNTYVCTGQGTSGGSGPTGTGSNIPDGSVTWAYYPVAEADSQAFVVYVPPNNGDNTFESCLRLGAPPTSSTADEEKTYKDIVSKANTLSGLSAETYNTTPGIALLTPGTINLVAAGGVNTTCGSYTHSTIGSSYVVTQDAHSDGTAGHIISAAYTSEDARGTWVTSSFNQALNVGVNTVPLQASIGLGAFYSISGPLNLSNAWGAIWNSTAAWSVSVQLARNVAIGLCSTVVTDANGSTSAYYTEAQGNNTGQQFRWVVPLPTKYADFDTLQGIYGKAVVAGSVAAGLVSTIYAIAGAYKANNKTPSEMQAFLDKAEGIAIACTVIDSLLWAAGIVLGFIVDDKTDDKTADNIGGTRLTVKDGNIELTTAAPCEDYLNPKYHVSAGPKLTVDRTEGITLTAAAEPPTLDKPVAVTDGATITVNGNEVKIKAATITLSGQVKFDPPSPAAPSAPSEPSDTSMSSYLRDLHNMNVNTPPNLPPK